MLHVFWLHVKYTLNVVQSTLVYIKCIGIRYATKSNQVTTKFVTTWTQEAYSWMKYQRSYSIWKDVQFSSHTTITKIVKKLKRWLLVVKIIKHSCKWRIIASNHKL
jgi:hypothetical protein